MKLINADEAFRVLSDYYHHRTETQADALREALGLVPEAVVRCGDCGWYPVKKMPVTFVVDQDIPDDICFFRETLGES